MSDSQRRARFRDLDGHASWRQVAYLCGVDPDQHEDHRGDST